MKKWFKKYIPTKKSIEKSPELKPLKPIIKKSFLWSLDCQSVARGVAAGLAGAVIPGFQFFYAALLAFLLRGNLPIALTATFITNPFTAVFVVYFIYLVGSLILGSEEQNYTLPDFSWSLESLSQLGSWALHSGKAFLVGLPVVSLGLGLIGYFGTILIWKFTRIVRQYLKR